MSHKRRKRVSRSQSDKPETASGYAARSRQTLEARHARHNPPVAACPRCVPVFARRNGASTCDNCGAPLSYPGVCSSQCEGV